MYGNGYDFIIYWGDGTDEVYTASPGEFDPHELLHIYDNPGTYRVSISGDFPRIYSRNSDDPEKILTVEQWGDIEWTSMADAFYGASNLTTVPSDEAPDLSRVTSTAWMFQGASSFNGEIGHWDVSTIENMVRMFYEASAFNQYIGDWNTSNVTNISSMFEGVSSFNQDISTKTVNEGEIDQYTAWDVSNVDGMEFIFVNATAFNQNTGNWDTGNIESMSSMFEGATSFNQDIGNWKTSAADSFKDMFKGATSFNQDISTKMVTQDGAASTLPGI